MEISDTLFTIRGIVGWIHGSRKWISVGYNRNSTWKYVFPTIITWVNIIFTFFENMAYHSTNTRTCFEVIICIIIDQTFSANSSKTNTKKWQIKRVFFFVKGTKISTLYRRDYDVQNKKKTNTMRLWMKLRMRAKREMIFKQSETKRKSKF